MRLSRKAYMTFVVIGGGPTGVELAGAIAEISRQVLVRDFRSIDPREAKVFLVEAGSRILSTFPETLSAAATASLEKLGVEVLQGNPVTGIKRGEVALGERTILAETILWGAGVIASPLARSLGVPLDRAGRVIVQPDLSIPGHPEAFVIGDMAVFTHQTGHPLPGTCPVAIQQGRHVANEYPSKTQWTIHRTFPLRQSREPGNHWACSCSGRFRKNPSQRITRLVGLAFCPCFFPHRFSEPFHRDL